jgi:hypothetical protein
VIIPVELRYLFLRTRKPECWVRIGEPVVRTEESRSQFTRRLELLLDRELEALDAEICKLRSELADLSDGFSQPSSTNFSSRHHVPTTSS